MNQWQSAEEQSSHFMMAAPISAGARYYGALTLPLYDLAVLKLVVQGAWGCPLEKEHALYDRCVGKRHLDVGVASGYFLDHAVWPIPRPEIVLMDLNPNSTRFAAHRLRRYAVSEVVGDALLPFPVEGRFDSIGLFHLLHCIPGSHHEKADVLRNSAAVLNPGGVVFGACVTPVDTPLNPFAKAVLKVSHSLGALNNQRDRHSDLVEVLHQTFADVKVEKVGCMSLWEARSPLPKE